MSQELSLLRPLAAPAADLRVHAEQLASDVKAVYSSLGRLMAELDRQVRRTVDPLAPLRRHPLSIVGLGSLALFVVGGVVAVAVRRHPRPPSPFEKARRLRHAVARMVENPDRVAQPAPGIGREVLAAVGTVIVATAAKRAFNRALSARSRSEALAHGVPLNGAQAIRRTSVCASGNLGRCLTSLRR